MKPIRDIIVRVEKTHKQTIKTESGFELLLDENIKQVKDTIRHGEVVAVPDDMPWDVRVGDELYFHHGIVGETVLNDQPNLESQYLIDREKHLFTVPTDKYWPMAYAVLRDGKFQALNGVCFVRPIIHKKYSTDLYIPNNEEELKSIGEMVYSNDNLREQGVDDGTKVVFSKDSEYKFDINGETLYAMFDRWILGIYESQ
jgi:co-chaperonin GroES (HSP10)